jgi:hypothetical protein
VKEFGREIAHDGSNSRTKHRRSISEKLFDPEEIFNIADFRAERYNVDKLIENFLQG